MTQTTDPQITLYRTQGKDRLSDDWVAFESRWLWEVEQWAEQRAWVQRNEDDSLLVETRTPGQARLEWFTEGAWEPYTAYVSYARALRALESQVKYNAANRFRIAEEAPPGE